MKSAERPGSARHAQALAVAPARGVRGWAYVAGAVAVALGIIHDASLSTQMSGIQSLTQGNQDGVVWLFLCTGTAVCFAGVLCMLTAGGLARGETGARRVTLASCVFLALLGGAGLAVNQIGALSLIVLAVPSLVPWWRTRRIIAAGGV